MNRKQVGAHEYEHEMEIMIDGISVPISQLEAYKASKAAAMENEPELVPAVHPDGDCPFSSGVNRRCKAGCAFCVGDACAVAIIGRRYEKAETTVGRVCPLRRPEACSSGCALNIDGACALVRIAKGERVHE